MKSNKINYLIVGSFVIAIVVGMVVSVALLTGRTGAVDSYYALYRNVTGVKFGTQVLYEGYPIGQVEKVTPKERGGRMWFRVDFDVTKGWRIPDDSFAQIAAPGLLAAMAININAGSNKSDLKPESEIKAREAANMLAVLSDVAGNIGDMTETSIKPLLANINRTVSMVGDLLQEDGRDVVKKTVALVRDLATRAPKILDDIESFSANMNKTSTELSVLLNEENRKKLEAVMTNLDQATRNMNLVMTSVKGMVSDNKEAVKMSVNDLRHVADTVARYVDSVNQNLDGAARNMYEFSRSIRQNPGLLLGGTPPADEAKR
jgi:phospholipid/cholesterol/gamma-HCH transport system substrate-binding protein